MNGSVLLVDDNTALAATSATWTDRQVQWMSMERVEAALQPYRTTPPLPAAAQRFLRLRNGARIELRGDTVRDVIRGYTSPPPHPSPSSFHAFMTQMAELMERVPMRSLLYTNPDYGHAESAPPRSQAAQERRWLVAMYEDEVQEATLTKERVEDSLRAFFSGPFQSTIPHLREMIAAGRINGQAYWMTDGERG